MGRIPRPYQMAHPLTRYEFDTVRDISEIILALNRQARVYRERAEELPESETLRETWAETWLNAAAHADHLAEIFGRSAFGRPRLDWGE